VNVHDSIDKELGKAIPYVVYDIGANAAPGSSPGGGVDHDTAEFAVNSIHRWLEMMGQERYPATGRLMITADGGGSNGNRHRLWNTLAEEALQPGDMRPAMVHARPQAWKTVSKEGPIAPEGHPRPSKIRSYRSCWRPVRIRAPNESPPLRQGKIFINPASQPCPTTTPVLRQPSVHGSPPHTKNPGNHLGAFTIVNAPSRAFTHRLQRLVIKSARHLFSCSHGIIRDSSGQEQCALTL
jgi:hypothetical protein